LLVQEGMKYHVGGVNGAGGLYEQDDLGTSPLTQLIHALNNPFTWEGQDAAREEEGEEEEERDLVTEDEDDNDGPQPQNNEQIVNLDMDKVTLTNTNIVITADLPYLHFLK